MLYGEDGVELLYTFISGVVNMMEDLTGMRGVVCKSYVEEDEDQEEGVLPGTVN